MEHSWIDGEDGEPEMEDKPSSILHPPSSLDRLHAALDRAVSELLAARTPDGHWAGELSGSALSTATAVIALAVANRESQLCTLHSALHTGLAWLAQHVNADGGWGDTTHSLSNVSTTALCWSAFGAVPGADDEHRSIVINAENWLAGQIGIPHSALRNPDPSGPPGAHSALVTALLNRYGRDRTFSVPILTACALAGRLGSGKEAWRRVLPLPFELAALPHQWFAALRLPVVSYALPALIAMGQARHFHLPSRNPFARLVRHLTRGRTLRVLTKIQPASGGFLEATPLTSFVVMSLAGSGLANHPVATKGIDFLLKSQRPDGSWPIDTNLATWLTTLAVDALGAQPSGCSSIQSSEDHGQKRKSHEHPPPLQPEGCAPMASADGAPSTCGLGSPNDSQRNLRRVCEWLLRQQYRAEHPYTHAAPGGWAWTDLPGGVPDADDTAGAVLALWTMRNAKPAQRGLWTADCGLRTAELVSAAQAGITWLLDLQNRDGGIPTFCRGWGALPFDRSSADLTAHAIRAWLAWLDLLPPDLQQRIGKATSRALGFLKQVQRNDGAWIPLWFGNQFAPNEENPAYGTARVVRALSEARPRFPAADRLLTKGISWLLAAQNTDGGWGGAAGVKSSVEETALAVEALAPLLADEALPASIPVPTLKAAVQAGTNWLLARVESGEWTRPTPIGFYFAKLWYYEKLYPQIFTVSALARAAQSL